MDDLYDGIKLGDVLSELELQEKNLNIYNRSLRAVATGGISVDGSDEYEITLGASSLEKLSPVAVAAGLHGADAFTINKFGGGIAQDDYRTIYSNMDVIDYPYNFINKVCTIQSTNAADTNLRISVVYNELIGDKWVQKNGEATTNAVDATIPVTVQELDSAGLPIGDAQIVIPSILINHGTGVTLAGTLIGTLTIENSAVIYNSIFNGDNQSSLAAYPIPSDFTAIVYGVGRSLQGANKPSTFKYNIIPDGETRQVKRTLDLTIGAIYEEFPVPFVFPGKTIMEVQCKINSVSGTGQVQGYWDMIIIRTTLLNKILYGVK